MQYFIVSGFCLWHLHSIRMKPLLSDNSRKLCSQTPLWSTFLRHSVLLYTLQCVPKTSPFLFFCITQSKISRFQQFLVYGILRKLATSRLQIAHLTWKVSLHYLVKFRTITVTSLLQKIDNKMFKWKSKGIKKTAKLTNLLSVFFITFFLCYFYSRSLYSFNQSL